MPKLFEQIYNFPVAKKAAVAVDTSDAVAAAVMLPRSAQPMPSSNEDAPILSYVALPGDSVGVLAGNLLGGDTNENRAAIIAANPSLHDDPDHLVAGKTYTIKAVNGLAADPAAPQGKAVITEADADEAAKASVGRTLRYTAQAGVTVSSLAAALIGSDTPANRELSIKSNASLK